MRRTRYSRARGGIVLLAILGLLVGPPSAPAKVTGPNLTFDPATFNFGTSPKAFTITNRGDTATGAIVVSRSGASNYTLGPDGCTGKSLGPGKSCSVTVSFTPPAPCGIVTATLTATAPKLSASAALTGGAACPAVSATLSATPSCTFFAYDVNLIASASGGTEPYTFTFTEGDTPLGANTSGILNVSFPALGPHTYSVTATDSSDITSLPATASATVPAPLELSISETRGDDTVDLSANVSGGAPPFLFLWSNGDTRQVTTVPKPVDTFDTYSLMVVDEFGCSERESWTVVPDQT